MAARRLIFVMLALLVVSTFAATFAAQQQSDTRESTAEDAFASSEGESLAPPLERRVDSAGDRRERIKVPLGRRLSLDVTSARADLVSIPRLGLLEDVAARSPAHFDLLLSERGTYAVRLVEAARTVATIEAGDGDADRKDGRPKQDGGEKDDSGER